MGYKIAAVAVLLLLGMTYWASYSGWGLRSTAQAEAEARRRGHSIRGGSSGGLYGRSYYGGGGPRFGK